MVIWLSRWQNTLNENLYNRQIWRNSLRERRVEKYQVLFSKCFANMRQCISVVLSVLTCQIVSIFPQRSEFCHHYQLRTSFQQHQSSFCRIRSTIGCFVPRDHFLTKKECSILTICETYVFCNSYDLIRPQVCTSYWQSWHLQIVT